MAVLSGLHSHHRINLTTKEHWNFGGSGSSAATRLATARDLSQGGRYPHGLRA